MPEPQASVTVEQLAGDPHPVLARLRATTPAAWIPALGGWLVTRHDLAAFGALRDSLSAAAPASPLAAARAGLSTDEFMSNAAVLLFGGIETTEGMITNAAWHLLSHPDALGAVRAERSLLAAAASGGTVLPAVGQDETVLVVVLSDTHAPRRWKTCPPAVAARLRGADLILHAGDVCTAAVLDELAAYAPVRAVAGNNDGPDVAAWGAPETLYLDLDGRTVAMIHDSGPRQGRMSRLRARFPAARLIVFGHSHIPWNEAEDGVRAFNPGSPTDRRSQPQGTIGLLRIEAGQVIDAHVIPVS